MKNLQQVLKEDYSEKMNSLKFSDKRKLYKLYEEPKHSPMLKKVVALQVVTAAIVLTFAVTAAATAGHSITEIVSDKTNAAGITEEKSDEIAERLESYNIDPYSVQQNENFLTPTANKYGEIVGNPEIGADLIAVGTKTADGENIIGYCYFDDFAELNEFSPNGESKNAISNWIYVYDIDGTEVVGKFVDGGFKTNEQLENSEIQIIESDEYEAFAQSRIDEKLNK